MKIKELPGSFVYDTLIDKSVYFFNGRIIIIIFLLFNGFSFNDV